MPKDMFRSVLPRVRFSGSDQIQLTSRQEVVKGPTGRPVNLRQWFRDPANPPKEGTPILLVPGLGGKTEWADFFVHQLIDQYPLVYGIDSLCFGPDPSKKGDLKNRKELVVELKEAVDLLSKQYNSKVVIAGISLGALTVTHYVADHPDKVAAAVLVNPAYRPAKHSFKLKFYAKTLVKYLLEKFRLRKPEAQSMPYTDDSNPVKEAEWIREARAQVSHLTIRSFLELFKMTFMESMRKAQKINTPTFMAVSGQDTIVSVDAMKRGFNKMLSPHKKMVEYPDAHHNILFEKDMIPMTQAILEWLKQLPQDKGAKPPSQSKK